jgi:predicted TIM-barrel fold metal-dependent hydrolase
MTSLPPYQDHVRLWEDELRDWTPETIFDSHVHLGPPDAMGEMSAERRREPLSTFTALTWPELSRFYSSLYGSKNVCGLIAFGFPLREVDIEAANRYIAELASQEPTVTAFILSDPRNTQRTIAQFHWAKRLGVRFRGVKPYFDFLGKSNYETTMPEFVPSDLLAFMNVKELALMLHTSGLGMSDTGNQNFVRSVCRRYPQVKVVLAHMGRYLDPRQFFEFLDSDVLDYPQVYLETSSVTCSEVYAMALERKDLWSRLVFGSDLPFGAITGVERSFEGTEPGMFLTRDDYEWSDRDLNQRFAKECGALTYNTYHMIKALKDAVEGLRVSAGDRERLKQDIFRNNAALMCG